MLSTLPSSLVLIIILIPVKSTITSYWVTELVAITLFLSFSFNWITAEECRSNTRGSLLVPKLHILTDPSDPAEYIFPDLSNWRHDTGPLWLISWSMCLLLIAEKMLISPFSWDVMYFWLTLSKAMLSIGPLEIFKFNLLVSQYFFSSVSMILSKSHIFTTLSRPKETNLLKFESKFKLTILPLWP